MAAVIAIPFAAGCAAPEPAPAPTPAPAPEKPESITLRWIGYQAPGQPMIVELRKALDTITKKTNGRLKFEGHFGTESGFAQKEFLHALEEGLTDMAAFNPGSEAWEYPWLVATSIPFTVPEPAARETVVRGQQEMLSEFYKEHKIVPLAWFTNMDCWVTSYSTKEIKSLSDVEGMRIRIWDPPTEITVGRTYSSRWRELICSADMTREPLELIVKGVIPFFFLILLLEVILARWPEIVEILPSLMAC